MHFTETRVAGAWIIDISPHHDERGRFMRAWCVQEFEVRGICFLPVQANMQLSLRKGGAMPMTKLGEHGRCEFC